MHAQYCSNIWGCNCISIANSQVTAMMVQLMQRVDLVILWLFILDNG